MTTYTPFTELFPIQAEALPKLYAYTSRGKATVQAAAKLTQAYGGRWAAADELLLTDTRPQRIDDAYQPVNRYRPTPTALAAYMIGALVPPLSDTLYRALQTPLQANFRVLQRPLLKPWEVGGVPALSIGLAQNLIHRQTLADYAKTIPDVRGLVRMTVVSRSPLLDYRLIQGVVADVTGTLADHRATLERLTRTKAARKRLANAPDAEPVLQIMTPFGLYLYAASALYITISPKDYVRLRVDAAAAQKASYQNIDARARGVATVSGVLKAMDYIGDAYRADKSPKAFLDAGALNFSVQVTLGDGAPRPYAPPKLWGQLQQVGMYGIRDDRPPLKLGVLSALGAPPPDAFDDKLIAALELLGLPVTGEHIAVTPGLSEADLAQAFAQFDGVNAVLAFISGKPPTEQSHKDDWKPFLAFKRATFAAEVYSLCVWEQARHTPQETALAFAGMLGHAPFALGEPLPFADFVVGLAYTPEGALAQVYNSSGVFVGYIAHSGPLDANGAAKLLPGPFFQGARVVLHTSAPLPEEPRAALAQHVQQINVTAHIGVVSADANPNLYAFADKQVRQPPTGTAFLLNEREALLVPAMPPHPAMPVNPVRVQAPASLPIRDALRAVLAMNTLHPTTRKPRTPRHLIDTPAIRQMLRAGVRPAADEGAFMWWL